MKRLPFLDWMRGLAVIVMIECHAFNSFTRMDLRETSGYILSQFVGGMAAPLFLFMAGMTFGFQMESLERREAGRLRRWLVSLRRAGYILAIAYLFRLTNWAGSLPSTNTDELLKVDILNCMGLAMLVFAAAALCNSAERVRYALFGGLVVAAAAPVISGFDWSGAAPWLRDYLVPSPLRGRFPFFPCGAYIGFGLAAGAAVKRTAAERMDRLMQWSFLIGLGLVFGARYFANLPFSIYANSDFWRNSPGLILIRVGISLLLLAGSYVWTEFCVSRGWSWIENFGKTSLLVYWVHVMLVYGTLTNPLRRALTISQAALATMAVIALMVVLAEARLRWSAKKGERWRAATTVAGAPA
ncbi:MAG: DUF1624 domain-containing protein [Acidobacteriia bacterium]|nr:DUF1624 domain-containing protein [Terriglobia bacterium]